MDRIVIEILAAVLIALVTALIAYYLATRDQRQLMDKVAKENVELHEKVKHQDSMYTYVENEVIKHENKCGEDIKKDVREMKSKLEVVGTTLVEHNVKLNVINDQLESLNLKMNRLLDHDRTGK
jgi:septal ring factor EnvC (AmiA/AmiB activator)